MGLGYGRRGISMSETELERWKLRAGRRSVATMPRNRLNPRLPSASLVTVDVPLNPDLQAKLNRLAEQQGRASTALIIEAVERMVDYDEWFLREVEKGVAEANRGEFVDHADVRNLIDERYPG